MTLQELELYLLQWEKTLKQATTPKILRRETVRLLDELVEQLCNRAIVPLLNRYVQEAWLCETLEVKGIWRRLFHFYRKHAANSSLYTDEDWIQLGHALFRFLCGKAHPGLQQEPLQLPDQWKSHFSEPAGQSFKSFVPVIITGADEATLQLQACLADDLNTRITVVPDTETAHESLINSFKLLADKVIPLPVKAHLIHVTVLEKGSVKVAGGESFQDSSLLKPMALVIEPDLLVNVTSISETFGYGRSDALIAANHRFKREAAGKSLVLGKAVNFMLDCLMENPNANYRVILFDLFRNDALSFLNLNEDELVELHEQLPRHYTVLRKTILQKLPESGILREECYLEPVFISSDYGLQGRLDVFYPGNPGHKKIFPPKNKLHQNRHLSRDEQNSGSQANYEIHQSQTATSQAGGAIIELKSGKARDEGAKISENHYIQTLLYEQLIRSAFGQHKQVRNYILYSSSMYSPLRFAPHNTGLQQLALNRRNEILAMDYMLMQCDRGDDNHSFIGLITDSESREGWPSFFTDAIESLHTAWQYMAEHERDYLRLMLAFTAREHFYSRLGNTGTETRKGMAGLWLDSAEEKEERFELLKMLRLRSIETGDGRTLMTFERTQDTHPLAHFRTSDIVLLYPGHADDARALNNQLFKAGIIAIDAETVVVALRNRQYQEAFFRSFEFWNIEKDVSDSGFEQMYKNMAAFFNLPVSQRNLWLGVSAPETGEEPKEFPTPPGLSPQQLDVFRQALQARNYYIIWGPPGTGKTSLMLRALVWHYAGTLKHNVLVLAYTNRAVDEICGAIESLGDTWKNQYIRLGSRHATESTYEHALLRNKIETVWGGSEGTHLSQLKNLLDGHRVYTATVAGLGAHSELLRYRSFDLIIADEASQIIEPMIINYFASTPKVIMIGDHLQLPAVVTQPPAQRKVQSDALRELGMHDAGDSLFERLMLRCREKGWHHAIGILSQQGRMHGKVMAFVNQHFYHNQLALLPESLPYGIEQRSNGTMMAHPPEHPFWQWLSRERTVFVELPETERSPNPKINASEALLIADLLKVYESSAANNPGMRMSIGIITPYRAQMAQIRDALNRAGLNPASYSIDTVERYQGSARDVILFATCIQHERQLKEIGSVNRSGETDRKLNVALTRARYGVAVFGRPNVLSASAAYRLLIDHYCSIQAWETKL